MDENTNNNFISIKMSQLYVKFLYWIFILKEKKKTFNQLILIKLELSYISYLIFISIVYIPDLERVF